LACHRPEYDRLVYNRDMSISAPHLLTQAQQLMQARAHEQAIPLLRELCAYNPDHAATWHALGLALCPPRYLQPGLHTPDRQAEALSCFQQACTYAPQHPRPWECLAYLYNLRGDCAAGEYHSIQAIDRYIARGQAIDFLPIYCLQEALFEQGKFSGMPCHLDFGPLQAYEWPHPSLPPGIVGNWPEHGPVVLISADSVYFQRYGQAQILSIATQSVHVHVHVHLFNPSPSDMSALSQLQKKLPLTHSYESVQRPADQARVVYASRRLQLAAWLLAHTQQPVLWTDADILFRAPEVLQPPPVDVAVVDYAPNGLCDRYGAAWVWLQPTSQGHGLARLLHAFISAQLRAYPDLWMVDQIALYCCIETLNRRQQLTLQRFPPVTVSFYFEPEAPIWNGAGAFKHEDNAWNHLREELLQMPRAPHT